MISPKEIMRGSILSYEGKTYVVKGISDFIIFEGKKEWIGGSLINGEPISEVWLERLGFRHDLGEAAWANGKMSLIWDGSTVHVSGCHVPFEYVHQLQIVHLVITGEHLQIPKK